MSGSTRRGSVYVVRRRKVGGSHGWGTGVPGTRGGTPSNHQGTTVDAAQGDRWGWKTGIGGAPPLIDPPFLAGPERLAQVLLQDLA